MTHVPAFAKAHVRATLLLSMLFVLGLPATAAHGAGHRLISLPGHQSNPTLSDQDVVFQTPSAQVGSTDLGRLSLVGSSLVPVNSDAGSQLSPSASGSLVAYVDREDRSDGEPVLTTALRVVDLKTGATITVTQAEHYEEMPSLWGTRLTWTRGTPGSRDVMMVELDSDQNGIADFIERPAGPAPVPVAIADEQGDQYGCSAGAAGVVWTDRSDGDASAIVFQTWGAGERRILAADAGFKRPIPQLGENLVVWKHKANDGITSDIAIHDLEDGSTSFAGAAPGSIDDRPVTDGSRVAWVSMAEGVAGGLSQVWVRQADGHVFRPSPTTSVQDSPCITPSTLVWVDAVNDEGDIAIWAPATPSPAAPKPTSFVFKAPSVSKYASAKLYGRLYDAVGTVLKGKRIDMQQYDGGKWSTIGSVWTSDTGYFKFYAKPTKKTSYRAVYSGDSAYVKTTSVTKSVLPKVYLPKPKAPTTMKRGVKTKVYGYLRPRHKKGTYPIKLKAYRDEGGKWVYKKGLWAKATNYNSTTTKYYKYVALPHKGKWRIRAYHPKDSKNAKTYSAYDYVTVK